MNNVEMLRQRCVRAVLAIAQFASMLPDGGETADLLKGEAGQHRVVRITDFIMAELGHAPPASTDSNSATRRAIKKVLRGPRG